MEQLLCQFQCPVQIATAVTLSLLTGVFSAFILSATTVRFIKESGKGWTKKKASVKANKLTCDRYSFGKTTSQVSVGLGFSSRDIIIMYLRRILAYPFFVFSLLYFIIILPFPINSLHLCHVWWVLYKPLAIHCTKLANEVIRPG